MVCAHARRNRFQMDAEACTVVVLTFALLFCCLARRRPFVYQSVVIKGSVTVDESSRVILNAYDDGEDEDDTEDSDDE